MTVERQKISEDIVGEVWAEFDAIDSESKAESFLESFALKQPSIVEFLSVLTEEFSEEMQELTHYMGLIVYNCYLRSFGDMRELSANEIGKLFEQENDRLEKLSETEGDESEVEDDLSNYSQPALIQFIVETLFDLESEESGDEDSLDDQDKGYIFMLLKVEIDCLDRSINN
ncbi:MAG: hypothetical protein HN353_02140 [Bdellovibrionales bacterium]|jgi:hypothetical protein|nr:hypothetical protein [Bdellovibrionales bacterium]MBT3525018.1 hypothetical protein [Bdellovibrionales bacterium]